LFYPINTFNSPLITGPAEVLSSMRTAGLFPIITFVLPAGNGAGGMFAAGTPECISPTTAAGMFAIRTVDTPGPVITAPIAVVSVTLAAGFMIVCLAIEL
jgi:hypothetical protein